MCVALILHIGGRWHRQQLVDWSDLSMLLYKKWTTRVWTYQEILLASRPVLVCGLSHLDWDDFIWSLIFLINFGDDNRRRILTT